MFFPFSRSVLFSSPRYLAHLFPILGEGVSFWSPSRWEWLMGVGAGATFAWIGVFFLYLSTFATFVVSADPQCIFCQLVQERKYLGGGGGQWSVRPPRMWAVGWAWAASPAPQSRYSVCLSTLSVCILNLFLFWKMLKVAHVFSCLCVKPLWHHALYSLYQVGTSRFRAEAMGNENSAPPAAGAWPDLQHKKRNATAELGRDRPGVIFLTNLPWCSLNLILPQIQINWLNYL
jgi:hypothetical protein